MTLVLPGGTRRTMQTTRTTVSFAKGKSDQKANRHLQQDPTGLFNIVIIIFHGMEYVTVNIEET